MTDEEPFNVSSALMEALHVPTREYKPDELWRIGGRYGTSMVEIVGTADPSAYTLYRTMYDTDKLVLKWHDTVVPENCYTVQLIQGAWEDVYRVTLYEDFVKGLDKNMPIKGAGANMTQVPSSDMQKAMVDVFLGGVGALVEQRVDEATSEEVKKLEARLADLKGEFDQHKIIEIKKDGKTKQIKGLKHKDFERLLSTVSLGFPIMLVGTAGTGKTYAAEQVAEALDLAFYSISVGLQTSKSDLFGYMNAAGTYVGTAFRKAYEKGGLFLLDEADAGNANVLVMLNSSLSGNACAFPDAMVKRHPDFHLIATANTYGTGASRMYVGRNQLDAATLDRFIVMDWDVDEALEAALVKSYQKGPNWHTVVKGVRRKVAEAEMRVIVSPRATVKGARLLETGLAFEDVVRAVLLPTATSEQRSTLLESAKRAWRL